MHAFSTCIDTYSTAYLEQYAAMLKLIAEVRGLQQRTVAASQRSGDRFAKRGQLLPRDRLARLLDPGAPFLELMGLTGYCGIENPDPQTSIPGSAVIAGIGFVQGVRVMIVVNDSAIEAGAMQNMTGRKVIRCQEIALENKLPLSNWLKARVQICSVIESRDSSIVVACFVIWLGYLQRAYRSSRRYTARQPQAVPIYLVCLITLSWCVVVRAHF